MLEEDCTQSTEEMRPRGAAPLQSVQRERKAEVWMWKALQVWCPEFVEFLFHDSRFLFNVEVKVIFRVNTG